MGKNTLKHQLATSDITLIIFQQSCKTSELYTEQLCYLSPFQMSEQQQPK